MHPETGTTAKQLPLSADDIKLLAKIEIKSEREETGFSDDVNKILSDAIIHFLSAREDHATQKYLKQRFSTRFKKRKQDFNVHCEEFDDLLQKLCHIDPTSDKCSLIEDYKKRGTSLSISLESINQAIGITKKEQQKLRGIIRRKNAERKKNKNKKKDQKFMKNFKTKPRGSRKKKKKKKEKKNGARSFGKSKDAKDDSFPEMIVRRTKNKSFKSTTRNQLKRNLPEKETNHKRRKFNSYETNLCTKNEARIQYQESNEEYERLKQKLSRLGGKYSLWEKELRSAGDRPYNDLKHKILAAYQKYDRTLKAEVEQKLEILKSSLEKLRQYLLQTV